MSSVAERALAEAGAAGALPTPPAAEPGGASFEAWTDQLYADLDALWVLICAFFVFQVGYSGYTAAAASGGDGRGGLD